MLAAAWLCLCYAACQLVCLQLSGWRRVLAAALCTSTSTSHPPTRTHPTAHATRSQVRHDILDWHGDHPHTNYHDMTNSLL